VETALGAEGFDEREERHLFVGDVEFFVGRNGAEAFNGSLNRTCLREEPTEGFEPAVPGDNLVARAHLSHRYRLKKPLLADARHQFSKCRRVYFGAGLMSVSVDQLEVNRPSLWRCRRVADGRDGRRHEQAPGWRFERSASHKPCRRTAQVG